MVGAIPALLLPLMSSVKQALSDVSIVDPGLQIRALRSTPTSQRV